jgi:thiamine-monophosphate kinase
MRSANWRSTCKAAPVPDETLGAIGEKRFIRKLKELVPPPPHGLGIGDDAAIVPIGPDREAVLSVDRVPSDLLALRLGVMDWYSYGRYLAEVNLSDIAAMGGVPHALLLAVAVPDSFLVSDLCQLVTGFAERGHAVGAPLVGGDTKCAPEPSFTATAVGSVPRGQALQRRTSQPGDRLFVSGTVGGFGAALSYLTRPDPTLSLPESVERSLLDRLLMPTARLELGGELVSSGRCTSCIDVSDGMRQALVDLAADSECEFDVDGRAVPLHPGVEPVARLLDLDPMAIAFGIGLDLELLGTWSGQDLPVATTEIGVARARSGIGHRLLTPKGSSPLPGRGWEHFSGDAATFVSRTGPHPAE